MFESDLLDRLSRVHPAVVHLGAAVLPADRRCRATGGADKIVELAGDRRVHRADHVHYLSIICARRSIYIANPYFIPDSAAIDALVEAKRRGVDVRVMVSGIHNDNWLARQNSVRLFGPLLKAGIEIHEYTARCCTTRRW